LEKHLSALSVDLSKIDAQIGIAFGKRITDKVAQAALDALVKFDFSTISKSHKTPLSTQGE